MAQASGSNGSSTPSWGRCSGPVPLGGGPGEEPEPARYSRTPGWPLHASGVSPEELKEGAGEKEVWASSLRLPLRPGSR